MLLPTTVECELYNLPLHFILLFTCAYIHVMHYNVIRILFTINYLTVLISTVKIRTFIILMFKDLNQVISY